MDNFLRILFFDIKLFFKTKQMYQLSRHFLKKHIPETLH